MTAVATEMDLDKLQAARVWVTARQPYLAIALHSLQLRVARGYGTFGVDRHWRLYVDPAVLDRWSVEQVGAVLVHEVWHVLRDHAGRGEVAAADQHLRWNLACDAEINDDLVAAGLPLPDPVTPSTFGLRDGGLAEEYFAAIRIEHGTDCGSGAHGVALPHEDGAPSTASPGLTPVQGDLVRIATARSVEDAARQGTVPSGWERWAAAALRPKVDWRTVLSASVRRGLASASGAVDYTRARPSRRTAVSPTVLLPALRRPVPSVAIVIDTSGSVDDEMLGQALAEVDGALQAGGVRRDRITVLSCDAAVGASSRVRSASQVALTGGGGTDMRVGIEAALALRPAPDVVVVLTDGDTPWPAYRPTRAKLVVALLRETTTEVPEWAVVVRAHE